jgi:putative methyltransferase (TIGR04325 family)
MSLTALLKQMVRAIAPRSLLKKYYERKFFACCRWEGLHFGLFASFEEAKSYLANRGLDGQYAIDHEQWAAERSVRFYAHDYPVLYWLSTMIAPGGRLVDIGGSVGVTYYLFRQRLSLPADFLWTVHDLPGVVAAGRELAAKQNAAQLRFTEDWREVGRASVLLSAGALQFIEMTLAEMLKQTAHRPEHLIINRLPLTAGNSSFVTLQNTGMAIAPVRVERLSDFVEGLSSLGYGLVDQWKCLENSLGIPLHPESTLPHFHGFCFRQNRT